MKKDHYRDGVYLDDLESELTYAGDRGGPIPIQEKKDHKKMGKRCRMGRLRCCSWATYVEMFLLPTLLIIAMFLGIGMGWLIREVDPDMTNDKRDLMYLGYPGELLLRMLKCIILPLIFTSLTAGMAALPSQAVGKLGGRTIFYYLSTTFLAVLLGILLVTTIEPGDRNDKITDPADKNTLVEPVDALLDLIRNVFPPNIVEAAFKQTKTKYEVELQNVTKINKTSGENYTIEKEVTVDFYLTMGGGSNILGVVFFSIVFGLMIGQMGEMGKPLVVMFDLAQLAIIKMVKLVIWYSPIGIVFLLAARVVSMDDPAKRFEQLGWYMMTVILGLFLHGFVVLPAIYFFFVRKNPFRLMMHMSHALLNALGTASSSATLPITMSNLENNARVHPLISRFMLPVGATINMDGTALYEAVAAIFIAQYNDIDLDAGQIITVSLTATAAAIGAAGVPEAGLVTMVIVLTSVGLPIEDIGLIYAVDWLLDRCRTAINVWGDSVGAATVEATVKDELDDLVEKAEKASMDSEPPSYNGLEHYVIANPDPVVSHL